MLGALNIPALTYENYRPTTSSQPSPAAAPKQATRSSSSGDRDIFQLVTDDVTLLYPVTTGPPGYSAHGPRRRQEKDQGTPPHTDLDKALTGEQADNLPGVPGVARLRRQMAR